MGWPEHDTGPKYQLLRVAASLGAAQLPSFTGTHGNDADNRRGNPNQPDTWQQDRHGEASGAARPLGGQVAPSVCVRKSHAGACLS